MIKKRIYKNRIKKKNDTLGTKCAVAPIPSLKKYAYAFTQLTSLQILSNWTRTPSAHKGIHIYICMYFFCTVVIVVVVVYFYCIIRLSIIFLTQSRRFNVL